MHECIKQAGTRDWAELCSHQQTELLEEEAVGQARLLPIRCFTRAFLYPPIDAVRCHNIRAETKGDAAESAKMLPVRCPFTCLTPSRNLAHKLLGRFAWPLPSASWSHAMSTAAFEDERQKHKKSGFIFKVTVRAVEYWQFTVLLGCTVHMACLCIWWYPTPTQFKQANFRKGMKPGINYKYS